MTAVLYVAPPRPSSSIGSAFQNKTVKVAFIGSTTVTVEFLDISPGHDMLRIPFTFDNLQNTRAIFNTNSHENAPLSHQVKNGSVRVKAKETPTFDIDRASSPDLIDEYKLFRAKKLDDHKISRRVVKRSSGMSPSYLIVVDEKPFTFSRYLRTDMVGALDQDGRLVNNSKDILRAKPEMNEGDTFYVAGEITEPLGDFVIGDGNSSGPPIVSGPTGVTRQYINSPLKPDTAYQFTVVAQNVRDDNAVRSIISAGAGVGFQTLSSSALQGESSTDEHEGQGSSSPWTQLAIALISFGFLLLFLLIVALLIYMCCLSARSKRMCTKRYNPPVNAAVPPDCPSLTLSSLSSPCLRFPVKTQCNSCYPNTAAAIACNTSGDNEIATARAFYDDRSFVCRSRLIPVKYLRKFCDCNVRISEGLSGGISRPPIDCTEFRLLPDSFTDSVHVANFPAYAALNRSKRVVPYDRNRVRLGGDNRDLSYINASVVRTIGRRTCTVTQCPMRKTVSQFWQMVWEGQISSIVMLLGPCADTSTVFCKYWPESVGDVMIVSRLSVQLVAEKVYAHYAVREISVSLLDKHAGPPINILHWQYTAWVRGGIPLHPVLFLSFVKRIREMRSLDDSYVVLCSTGGGRSGVYIAVDTLLTQGRQANCVDVMKCVALLRTERPELVRTLAQYQFVYECLADEFDHGTTRFHNDTFVHTFEQLDNSETASSALGFEHQLIALPFYLSKGCAWNEEYGETDDDLDNLNQSNNSSDLRTDQIVMFDRFLLKNGLILAQCPSEVLSHSLIMSSNCSVSQTFFSATRLFLCFSFKSHSNFYRLYGSIGIVEQV